MTLAEIKAAVLACKTVHWKNGLYQVVCYESRHGNRFMIECIPNGSLTSLTWADGVTMSEKPEDFFIAHESVTATFRKPDGEIVRDSNYHEPMAEARAAAEEDAHRYGWEFLGVEVGQ